MARRRIPIEQTPGWTIYQELLEYIDQYQVIPNVSAFFDYLVKINKYTSTDRPLYRYYMERRLIDDGLIAVDRNTRAIRILERRIVPVEAVATVESPVVKKRISDW